MLGIVSNNNKVSQMKKERLKILSPSEVRELYSASQFTDLDLSTAEENTDESVRIIINEAAAFGNIYQQLQRLTAVKSLWLCV